ncbi:MAG: hypothetical protein ACRDDX_11905 [Cellulosilyticaceae bacterium]
MKGMASLETLLTRYLFFFGFAILGATFAIYLKKSTRTQHGTWQDFRKAEQEANFCTKKDFPSTLLLTFEKDKIPYVANPQCENIFNQLMAFKDQPMVNLSSYTNLQLKKQFGMNHFTTLVTYEETYNVFLETLYKYALCLYEQYYTQEAIDLIHYLIEKNGNLQKYSILLNKMYDTIKQINN